MKMARTFVGQGAVGALLVWMVCTGPADAGTSVPLHYPMPTYCQEFRIVFDSAASAARAEVAILPLYKGAAWAISCRWDDNALDHDQAMQRLMNRYGIHGTWYVNRTDAYFNAQVTRRLIEGGHSIGGHSLTHPHLSYLNRNRIFEEIMGIRIDREASTDSPVHSFAFPHCDFRNDMEGDRIQEDITMLLERAGFYHVANGFFHRKMNTGMILSPLFPGDGKSIAARARKVFANAALRTSRPMLSFAMHAWAFDTPEKKMRLEQDFKTYGGNPEWWYCNQNQYAAYRYQYKHAVLTPGDIVRNVRTFRLARPVLADLNDAVPLTLEVAGVARDAVREVLCADTECRPLECADGTFRFHLHHHRDRLLPEKIGHIPNPENIAEPERMRTDQDFPWLKALLWHREDTLHLRLENHAGQPVRRLRITYRLPLGWEEGVVRSMIPILAPSGHLDETLPLTPSTRDYKYHCGSSLFAAQLDFRCPDGRRAGRLYVTCRVGPRTTDATYPQGGFQRFGPIPDESLAETLLARIRRQAPRLTGLPVPEDTPLQWEKVDGLSERPYLDPECIRTTGSFRYRGKTRPFYLLVSRLHVEDRETIGLLYDRRSLVRVEINGKKVDGDTATLDPGPNILALLYRLQGKRWAHENAGCFLRLVHPESRARMRTVRFDPDF